MEEARTPEQILREIAAIDVMERGKLSEMRRPTGQVYYNLQFWTGGRNRCDYVSAKDVDAVREAVANHARFLELVDEYAALIESNTRRARKGAGGAEKKNVCAEKRRQPRQTK